MTSIDKAGILKKERKSRRTHKNSRDGCPNCKAKRIKCSEDLPQCQNCIKKEYRCGYLDFPPERLEQIRLKNERKKQGRAFHDDMLTFDMVYTYDPVPQTFKPNEDRTEHFFVKKDILRYQLYRDSILRVVEPTDPVTQFIQSPTVDELESSKAGFFGKDFFDRRESIEFPLTLTNVHEPQPLPDAYVQKRLFKKLRRDERLKNTFISLLYKKFGGDRKQLMNDRFSYEYAPVWTSQHASIFWTSIYNQSVILGVYFTFFMDRSLNILLKSCHDFLSMSGDSPPSTSNSPYNDSPTSSIVSNLADSCYNYEDMAVLTQKSYMIYGKLIKNLRESLSGIHIEYLCKISLFSAWSSFLHVHASMETASLIYTGTISLLTKICNDAKSIDDITPTIRVVLDVINLHLTSCLIPDYRFSVMNEIYNDLEDFMNQFGIADGGNPSDRDPLCDKISAFQLISLRRFLRKLIFEYYPSLQRINQTKLAGNDNIHFVDPASLCMLMVDWFRIFPSELMGLSSKSGFMTKMSCLFFVATGKALQNVLTTTQSIWLIDMCNIICPRYDTNLAIYSFNFPTLGDLQYQTVSRIQRRLIRMTSFFSNRIIFYAHLLSTTSVLDGNFTRLIQNSDAPSGIIEILPDKLNINEQFVSLFDDNVTINYENYPRIPEFEYDRGYQEVIHQSKLEQESALQQPRQINFSVGLNIHDFDHRELMKYFIARQLKNWNDGLVSIQQWRNRMNCVEVSRRDIATCGSQS